MRIKKVRLKDGYKRFHDLTIDLGENPKRIVALVGPNGCGKSSVLDGILIKHRTFETIGNKGNQDYRYHSMEAKPSFNPSVIEIQLTEGNYDSVAQTRRKSGSLSTIFSFRSPYRYNSSLNVTEIKAVKDIKLNNYGASAAADIDEKIEENYRRLYAKFHAYQIEHDAKPSEAKAKIIGDLNAAIKNCLDLEIDNIGIVDAEKGSLFFRKKDHQKEFGFDVLSSGEKEVIDILLDLYLRKEDYTDTIFLLDEPELHINTSIQKNLLIEINKLVGENCQIWITTHSIGFLRALQGEMKDECQIIQFNANSDFAAKPYVLTPMEMSKAKWREVFSVALDDLVQLISPKQIIYCEGRDIPGKFGAERGMDAKAFNSIFSHNYPDTLFVSSGGNTELDQRSGVAIAILSKAISGLEILVLKDRDMASGKITTEQDRQIYLKTNPANHRLLKRWEIENYLYDKEVLSVYCSKYQTKFDVESYDSFVTDIQNQNLKDETARIKKICGIVGSVNPEAFKIDIAGCITSDMHVYKELESCIFVQQ